ECMQDVRGGEGKQKIAGEESKLNKHDLGVVQIEDILEMRNQNVIQRRDKAPEKEQDGHHGESGEVGFIGSLPCGRRGRRRAYVCHKVVVYPFSVCLTCTDVSRCQPKRMPQLGNSHY